MSEGELTEGNNQGLKELPPNEISKVVHELCDFYHFPESMRARALNTKVFFASKETFSQKLVTYAQSVGLIPQSTRKSGLALELGILLSGKDKNTFNKETDERLEAVKQSLVKLAGVCIPVSTDKSFIYLKEGSPVPLKLLLVHELLHAASDKDQGKGTGFQGPEGANHDFNEAAVQILALAYDRRYPDFKSLCADIQKNKIPPSYRKQVSALATALDATTVTNKPYSIQELADNYVEGNVVLFKMNLLSRTPIAFRPRLQTIISSL